MAPGGEGSIYLFIYMVDNLVEVEHGSLALFEPRPFGVLVDRADESLLSMLAGHCNHLHQLPLTPFPVAERISGCTLRKRKLHAREGGREGRREGGRQGSHLPDKLLHTGYAIIRNHQHMPDKLLHTGYAITHCTYSIIRVLTHVCMCVGRVWRLHPHGGPMCLWTHVPARARMYDGLETYVTFPRLRIL